MHAQNMPYRPGRFVLAAAALLAVPLLAMQVTSEVNWSPGDFLLAGILLTVPAVLYELAARRPVSVAYRAALGHALASLLLLVWVNLAVGFVGEPENGVNLLFFAVPVVVLVGAVLSGVRPRGMAVTMVVAAAVLLGAAASGALRGPDPAPQVIGLGIFFAALLVGPAYLFRTAAGEEAAGRQRGGGGLFEPEGLRVQLRLSVLLAIYGALLLAVMAVMEGEPGAIPLGALLGGVAWHAVVRHHLRGQEQL